MRVLREHLQLTQRELAEEIQCARSLVSMAEYGLELGGATTRRLFDRYRPETESLGLTAEDFLRGAVARR